VGPVQRVLTPPPKPTAIMQEVLPVSPACAFCGILDGRTPAHVVHRAAGSMAFLDARPLFLGHTLLVPRRHVLTLADLPGADVPEFFGLAQRLERAVVRATDADGSLVLVNNVVSQSVPHMHLHVIPRRRGDGLRFWLGPRRRYDSEEHAAATAEAIAARLAGGQTTREGDA